MYCHCFPIHGPLSINKFKKTETIKQNILQFSLQNIADAAETSKDRTGFFGEKFSVKVFHGI